MVIVQILAFKDLCADLQDMSDKVREAGTTAFALGYKIGYNWFLNAEEKEKLYKELEEMKGYIKSLVGEEWPPIVKASFTVGHHCGYWDS